MKHKIGDKVKVRGDLEHGKWYGKDTFEAPMEAWCGQMVTIVDVFENNPCYSYYIEEDDQAWDWTNEMFEEEATNENT